MSDVGSCAHQLCSCHSSPRLPTLRTSAYFFNAFYLNLIIKDHIFNCIKISIPTPIFFLSPYVPTPGNEVMLAHILNGCSCVVLQPILSTLDSPETGWLCVTPHTCVCTITVSQGTGTCFIASAHFGNGVLFCSDHDTNVNGADICVSISSIFN